MQKDRLYPLTQTQLGIYTECVRREGGDAYNTTTLVYIDGHLDPERLADAVRKALLVHPAFFARIVNDENGTPCMQYVAPETDECLCEIVHMEDKWLQEHKQELPAPFDLQHDRLFRVKVIVTELHVYLCYEFHHIIFDGSTRKAFSRNIDKAYRGEPLETETVTGFDIAEREWNLRQTDALENARKWNLSEFGDCEGISLPEPDRLSSGAVTYGTYYSRLHLTPGQLSDASRQLATPVSVLTYCAFGRVLSAYTGKKDVCFATIWHGRHDRDCADTAMMMVKTFPVRFCFDEHTVVSESLDLLKHQVWSSRDNDTYSFLELCSETNITGNLLFAYHGNLRECAFIDGCCVTPEQENVNETGTDMAFSLIEMHGELIVKAEYFSHKYSEELVARMVDSLDAVLLRIMHHPEERVSRLSVVSEVQQKELDRFHQVATCDLPVRTFHEGIERWAETTPDILAVVATDRTLTFKEYNEAANRMARALMARGVTRGDRIVLLLPRTSHFLVSLLAVMKCGAAYIPMDPAYPADRISYILSDSEGRYVVTTSEHVGDYADKAIDIEVLARESASYEGSDLHIAVNPHDLAYLIYTSGSTGKPKGVMLEHLGVANFFTLHPSNYIVRTVAEYASVTLCQTTVSFDLSIFEYGTPLFNGKTVVFANEEETMNPFAQAELCRRTGVECISGTPSRIAMNLELNAYEDLMKHQIRAVMMGGEKLPWSLVERLKSMEVKIVNGYGPTETTMGSSGALMNDATFVHIGKPSANYSYRILDSDLNELPVGVMGELVIGGLSLARGYNKLPEKTAAAFIQWNGERLYRTGDYARWTKEGDVIILGRTDNQVKLNGLRIELGEIETVMAKQPGVKQCVVLIKKMAGQDKLVAYYVCQDAENPDVNDIKAGMAEHLTHYMVPGVFVRLDRMPLTPAGKVDVKHLPEPETVQEAKVAPANEEEQKVFEVVAEILGNEDFGVTTNLLSAGMTSLLSIRLSILLKKTFNQGIKVADIMSKPTVREISSLLQPSGAVAGSTTQCITPSSAIRPNTPFHLTFAQQGVYLDCLKNPDTTLYNIPVLWHLPSGIEVESLRSAVTEVLQTHPALFTRIVHLDEEPVMLYPKTVVPEIEVLETTEEKLNVVSQQAVQPFDLSKGPLYRAKIMRTEVGLCLFLDIHHLVSDGASMNLIQNQIADVLNGKSVEKEGCSYFEFADKQRLLYESEVFLDQVAFYDASLRDLKQSTAVPADFQPDGEGTQGEVGLAFDSQSAHFADDLDAFCRTYRLTQAQFWYAVTSFVLGRYAGTEDVYLCGISGGRQNLDMIHTVGMFVNTLALHSHIDDDSVREYLSVASGTFSETMRHEDFPFSDIAAHYGFRPFFNYVYQLGLMSDPLVGGEKMRMESLETKTPKFPVSVSIEYRDGKPSVVAMYDDSLYAQETMRQFVEDMLRTAATFIDRPEARTSQIEVPGAALRIRETKFDISCQEPRNVQRTTPVGEEDSNETANEVEQRFCEIFARILGREKVGANDDFFELGGTSLVAVKVVIEAMNVGYKIDYKTLFDHSTPRLLARTLQTSHEETTERQVLRDAKQQSRTLSSEQTAEGAVPSSSSFTHLLSVNTLDSFRQGKMQRIRGAVVTGATGYLGLHVIQELIDRPDQPVIYCMVRSNKMQTALKRFRALLFYYFDDSYDDLMDKRLFVVEGDVTKPESFDQLPVAADGITHLFNCAANVKHFSAGTDIEDINLGGTRNCIDYCLRAGVMMVQTSTYSVAGTTVGDHPVSPHRISEREFYWGQTLDNQYIKAKFEAEKAVLEAIENRGLNGKIMRLGNLSARSTDGEFQVNFSTNSFMGRLRALQVVGCVPYEAMSASIEFSPINEVARAVVLLSETPRENIIFHPVNANTQPYGNVINCLNRLGIDIKMAEQETFQQALVAASADESKATILQSMLAYQNVADGKFVVFNGVDDVFTTQILLRMGFQWSFTTWDYIEKFITAIKGLGFFDEDYER